MKAATLALWLYPLLGLAMNLLSLAHRRRHGRGLTPVAPWGGIGMMLLYVVCLGLGQLGHSLAFHLGLLLCLPLIGWGGVLRHLWRVEHQGYAGAGSRLAALGINLYGVLVSLWALAQ
ncbi:hypothetical protein J4P02_23195 [Pseudomonas sp. NFXW11]|uniref:hypothetical protein n=1 Tax=Pseudomonas sp. NFXW11 TaxID=2819531 RepID=UPI003CEF642F